MVMFTERLTNREIQILERLVAGLSDQQIADELFLSLNTVKWYNRQIYGKLGVSSRTQAISRAHELNLYEGDNLADLPARAPVSTSIHHLPADITSFIGRKYESAELKILIHQNRLVTLVGLPGMGKTRLSIQVAREEAGAFEHGVYFVPLAPVQAVENILWAITDHMDFQFESRGEPLQQLLTYLREKTLLMVLDNFDHLIAGGGLLTEILRAAPGVKMLLTSRERLNLYGEIVYTLGGMSLPDDRYGNDSANSEAVELFVERAKSVRPELVWKPEDLQHIIRICCLAEGMPLGIELAATWINTLLPQEIATEIERDIDILEVERQDVPQSQRSIRAAFDRSWKQLDESQAAAFRKLSVFRGGLTRVAGEAVAGVRLRTLQALVNKSLVRHNSTTGRYEIHELLRHYAEEHLTLSGESDAVYQAHAAFFADFMDERWPRMKDFRQKSALKEIRSDIENVRAAWQFWIAHGSVPQLKKFLHSFWVLYDIQGWYSAGVDLFEQAVQVMRAESTEEADACLGWLLSVQGLFGIPVQDYDESAEDEHTHTWLATHGLYNAIGIGPEHGFTLAQNGVRILMQLQRFKEMKIVPLISLFITASQMPDENHTAHQAALDCLKIAMEIDDRWSIAKAKQFLAVLAIESGEYEHAARLADEALTAFGANGDNWSVSVLCTEVLGLLAITLKQFDAARSWIWKGLQAAEEIDFKYSIQTAYWQLGYVAALEENYGEAGVFWHRALAVSDRMLGGRSFIGFGSRRREADLGKRIQPGD